MKRIVDKVLDLMPDKIYLKIMYRRIMGKPLNLKQPKTFNEKLQWLKLYNREIKYTMLVDKYLVRSYVAEQIGERYLIPLIGVWDLPDDIPFDTFPEQFVLKCNHNSGLGMCICEDKSALDFEKVKRDLLEGLKQNYYLSWREWPYKNVKPRIIAEKYMEDSSSKDLIDYKLMCFNGKVKCSFVCEDRLSETGLKVTFYDTNWKVMPFERHYPKNDVIRERPSRYEEMVSLAEKLSKDIPFVRVDFYEVQGKIYFGEMTFYPGAGFEKFNPPEWDKKLGDWLVLPDKKT